MNPSASELHGTLINPRQRDILHEARSVCFYVKHRQYPGPQSAEKARMFSFTGKRMRAKKYGEHGSSICPQVSGKTTRQGRRNIRHRVAVTSDTLRIAFNGPVYHRRSIYDVQKFPTADKYVGQ